MATAVLPVWVLFLGFQRTHSSSCRFIYQQMAVTFMGQSAIW